jgi:hypothetical protein
MSSDLTFLTNEQGNTLRERFQVLLGDNTRFFDVLVGYFFVSGFHQLYPSLENMEKIRILVGLRTDSSTVDLLRQAKEEQGISAREKQKARRSPSGSLGICCLPEKLSIRTTQKARLVHCLTP